jgi:hypothetical protein
LRLCEFGLQREDLAQDFGADELLRQVEGCVDVSANDMALATASLAPNGSVSAASVAFFAA